MLEGCDHGQFNVGSTSACIWAVHPPKPSVALALVLLLIPAPYCNEGGTAVGSAIMLKQTYPIYLGDIQTSQQT